MENKSIIGMGQGRKAVLCMGLAVLLLTVAVACSAAQSPEEALEQLLAKDYEVYYLFRSRGLPVDDSPEAALEWEGGVYQPSLSEEYKSVGDLKKLLEGTYARDETVEQYLAAKDDNGHPLFVDLDGRLCQSSQSPLQASRFTVVEDTAQLVEETEDRAVFTLEEESLDGSLYQCTVTLVRTDRGWRLETPMEDAEQTLLREGSDPSSEQSLEDARQVAESFLTALAAGDTARVEELSQAVPGTYSSWASAGVAQARITETLEEGPGYGLYEVSFSVSENGGTFPQGENRYRLEVTSGEMSGELIVGQFRPAEPVPYNLLPYQDRQDAACEAVLKWVELFGPQTFADTGDLSEEMVAEYCLTRLAEEMSFDQVMEGIQPETLEEAALEWFGLEGFDARETGCYDPQRDVYLTPGRSGSGANCLVMGSSVGEDGTICVEVRTYTDPLQTQNQRIYTYLLSQEEEEDYRFLSAQPADGGSPEQQ